MLFLPVNLHSRNKDLQTEDKDYQNYNWIFDVCNFVNQQKTKKKEKYTYCFPENFPSDHNQLF